MVSSCAVSIQTSPRQLCSFPWHTLFFLAEAFHSSIPSLSEQLGAALGGVPLSNTDKSPALLKLIFWGGVVRWNGL